MKVGRGRMSSLAGPHPFHNAFIARQRGWEAIKRPETPWYVGNLGP